MIYKKEEFIHFLRMINIKKILTFKKKIKIVVKMIKYIKILNQIKKNQELRYRTTSIRVKRVSRRERRQNREIEVKDKKKR